jgi:RNA polymerase sigma-70 factor (ECF subfamily)
MNNITDYEIIDSVVKGNAGDFALLINRYKDRAFSMLKRMLKNEQEAEEALQDSFLKCFNSLATFRKEAKFSTWFYRIVYNTAVSRLAGARRKFEAGMLPFEEEEEIFNNGGYEYEKTDFAGFVISLVDLLPPKYATVLSLFYINGLSCEEIAEVTAESAANIKVILHRARTLLRKKIEKRNLKKELL